MVVVGTADGGLLAFPVAAQAHDEVKPSALTVTRHRPAGGRTRYGVCDVRHGDSRASRVAEAQRLNNQVMLRR